MQNGLSLKNPIANWRSFSLKLSTHQPEMMDTIILYGAG
jgi:hypothetical protein